MPYPHIMHGCVYSSCFSYNFPPRNSLKLAFLDKFPVKIMKIGQKLTEKDINIEFY